jgi:predicted MPP superfamily phosphohydrolase
MNAVGTTGHVLYKIAAVLMGVYLFLVLSFLMIDFIALFIKLKPLSYGIVSIGLATIVSIYGYWNGSNIRTTTLNIPIKGISDEIIAVHLSDIHIGHFRTNGYLDKIVNKTNAQNPDVIFLTGDYLDSKYALNKVYFEPLRKLKAPVYFVNGNHDHATSKDSISALMRSVGVKVLENELVQINDLQIIGLNHMFADRKTLDFHSSSKISTIHEVLPTLGIDKQKASVLLHHAPNGIKYANKHGVDLYLAGHTHAGQLFPFNIFAKLIFEYNKGLHDFKGTKIFVSQGVGTFGPPFRIGTISEIVSLKLFPD